MLLLLLLLQLLARLTLSACSSWSVALPPRVSATPRARQLAPWAYRCCQPLVVAQRPCVPSPAAPGLERPKMLALPLQLRPRPSDGGKKGSKKKLQL